MKHLALVLNVLAMLGALQLATHFVNISLFLATLWFLVGIALASLLATCYYKA